MTSTKRLTNQGFVFDAFGEGDKLTISEIANRVNEVLPDHEKIHERTIRRTVESMVKLGFMSKFTKSGNATVYGRISTALTANDLSDEVVPLGDNLVTVEKFLRAIADPNARPLKRSQNILAEKSQHVIRRLMVFTILSAGESGHDPNLQQASNSLHAAIAELNYVQKMLKAFVDSPIWYPHYRDKLAAEVREVQRKDPELFQLAQDYMLSER